MFYLLLIDIVVFYLNFIILSNFLSWHLVLYLCCLYQATLTFAKLWHGSMSCHCHVCIWCPRLTCRHNSQAWQIVALDVNMLLAHKMESLACFIVYILDEHINSCNRNHIVSDCFNLFTQNCRLHIHFINLVTYLQEDESKRKHK